MPCFKGLAVSIHSDGQLEEYAQQKQNRQSRISSYIAVPPAKVPEGSTTGNPEQPGFAISITLLTPGLNVPYSTPPPSEEDPYPRPRVVGSLPGTSFERGRYQSVIAPYHPRTTNPNETVAAYIYFDGRAKEEVATLLRRGEETWVNSRWVSIPESEGGGLAEREFLFREVGLERWLNGLDLEGSKNKAAKLQKRQQRLDRKRKGKANGDVKHEYDDDVMTKEDGDVKIKQEDGNDSAMNGDALENGLSPSDSDDEPPEPEAAGQIKIALFRVLASGEIKRGEYSPQFDAHDDDEGNGQNRNGDAGDEDVDHTTSFAKPKTLDPKSISTQTVTGIDPPDSPYAVFTFFYRGKHQLQKMGILPGAETQHTATSSKRKSAGPDFSKLNPLNKFGTVGFSGYRDPIGAKRGSKDGLPGAGADAMDSDNDEDEEELRPNGSDDVDIKNANGGLLSPEDARRQGEIAEGVQKIKLKRQHSAEPLSDPSLTRKSPHLSSTDSPLASTPQSVNSIFAHAGTPPADGGTSSSLLDSVASPYKRHRGSVTGLDTISFAPLGPTTNDSPAQPKAQHASKPGTFGTFGQFVQAPMEDDEEL